MKERFIARTLVYRGGVFTLKGYFFKDASFNEDELEKLEPIVISERWFQKRLGTLLSRSNPSNVRSGKNVNLKLTLRDGRAFYIPGEMGRTGVWGDDDGKNLRAFLEARVLEAPDLAIKISD